MSDGLIVLIGALLGAVPGFYAILSGRTKVKAEAASIVSDTAMRLIAPLQERIDKLEGRVARLEEENELLRAQVREFKQLIRALWEGGLILSKQLESRGSPLAWDPRKWRAQVEKALGVADTEILEKKV
jgi:chromosome segregation ATPase